MKWKGGKYSLRGGRRRRRRWYLSRFGIESGRVNAAPKCKGEGAEAATRALIIQEERVEPRVAKQAMICAPVVLEERAARIAAGEAGGAAERAGERGSSVPYYPLDNEPIPPGTYLPMCGHYAGPKHPYPAGECLAMEYDERRTDEEERREIY